MTFPVSSAASQAVAMANTSNQSARATGSTNRSISWTPFPHHQSRPHR